MSSPLSQFDLYIEPSPRRVRVEFGGEVIAQTQNALLVHERGHLPVYYFPADSVRTELLRTADQKTQCARKGEASYWHIDAGGRHAANAVWRYASPSTEAGEALKDYYAFEWKAVDAWFEEEEELFQHPHARDPYKRVDAISSSRHVKVWIDDEVIAESSNAVVVFETGLPTRYYLPLQDVRSRLLVPSARLTTCPYKGQARYWSAKIGDKLHEDVVWSYPTPIREIPKIAGLLSFYQERATRFEVDGKPVGEEAWHRSVLDFFNHGSFYRS
ncbi:DUF427 domain-containing protein [Paraburkholderia nemoris]|uniref:DUF427 domain-containing protein n=1 Tax=Paraburkholderia nemoris TaxID=2793076 RepID=UPI0038BBF610